MILTIKEKNVRFQVLTAASMMFRVVFWDILPCKMIVDRRFTCVWLVGCRQKHVETPRPRSSWYICPSQDNTALRQTRRHFLITLIPSRALKEALPRAELHPLDILSRYTSLCLFYLNQPPTAIGRFHDWPPRHWTPI
jgi:hypothetical protein